GDLATVLTALTSLSTGAQVRAALDALTGVVYTNLPTVTAEDTWSAMDLVFQHLSDVQSGTSAATPALTAFAPGLGGQAGPVTWAGNAPGDPTGWLTPLTSSQTLQGTANAPGFTNQSTGLLLGYDYVAGPRLTWGYAAGTWQSSLTLANGNGTAGITTVAGAVYGGYTAGAFEARGLIGYGVNNFQTTRPINFGDLSRTATASGTGNEIMAGLEADYRLQAGALTVRPTLGIQYVHLTEPAFNESGAGSIDLGVNAVTADWLQGLAGVRLDYAQTTAAGTQITYTLHAEYTTLATEPVPQIQTLLLGAASAGPFLTTGITAAPNSVGAGARITLHASDRYDLYAGYDAAWSSNETNQTFSAGLLIHF
ncbi:MAG TPA: autotransporter outer membrane beta-barrel domain-containing protein, partial [bacterium]|nr:autotransporter outer membrane beta-barrel domain-containing protein [bacterium]